MSSHNLNISKGVKAYSISYSFESTGSVVKTLKSISLSTNEVKTVFNVGDEFTYSGLVVNANYSNNTTKVVTPTSVSSPDMSSAGTKVVTVSYTEDGVTKFKDVKFIKLTAEGQAYDHEAALAEDAAAKATDAE